MKVSSPIGELPFEPQRVSVTRRGIEISGVMGAWPAHVHLDTSDLPALARLAARPAAVAAALVTVAAAIRLRGRRRSRPQA